MNEDPAQEQEWLRHSNLIYGALIGIGVVMVQPFLAAVAVHSAGFVRLEFDQKPTPQEVQEPGDTDP